MIIWNRISISPPPMTRVLVWRNDEAFTAYLSEKGEWYTDPEPTLHPISGTQYPFSATADACGITHWAYIQPPF